MGRRKKAFTNYTINKNIAKTLVLHRVWNGYTQSQLAKCINVSFQQIQKYERGQNLANPIRLLSLTQYFNVTIDYWVKPILNRELLLIKKKRGINVYPFKERFVENQANQSHE